MNSRQHSLTRFQQCAEERINATLKNHGHSTQFSERGENETYLHARLTDLDLEIWIYQDELEFSSPDLYRHYEKQDWPDPEEMALLHFWWVREGGKCLILG